MKHSRIFILFIVLIMTGIQADAQKSSGKLFLSKGLKLQLENTLKSVTGLEMMGQTMEMTADVNMVHDIEVKDKTDTSFYVNSTLTKMKSNASAMGQSQSFDSDKKEDLESETGKMMKGMLNVKKEVELNQSAREVNVKKDTSGLTENGGMMDMLKNMMSGSMDGSNGTTEAFMVIPTGKKSGDTWSDSLIADGVKMFRNFTLKQIKGNDATILFSGSQSTSKKIDQMGMEVNVNMDATLSGESLIDIKTGIVKQKTLNMDGNGTAKMMGQNIPMTTKVISTTIVKSR